MKYDTEEKVRPLFAKFSQRINCKNIRILGSWQRQLRRAGPAQEEPARRAEPADGGGLSRVQGDDEGGDQRAVVLAEGQRAQADGGDGEIQEQPFHVHTEPESTGEESSHRCMIPYESQMFL